VVQITYIVEDEISTKLLHETIMLGRTSGDNLPARSAGPNFSLYPYNGPVKRALGSRSSLTALQTGLQESQLLYFHHI
jgi:hypothetical protein